MVQGHEARVPQRRQPQARRAGRAGRPGAPIPDVRSLVVARSFLSNMQSVLQNAQSVVLWTDELSPDVRSLVSCRSVLSNMQQSPAECSVGPSSLNNRTEPPLCACRVNIRDLPVREYLVTANYPIEIRAGSDVGHTPHNGATRQIPNTQHLSTPSDGNTIPSGDSRPLAHEDFSPGCCVVTPVARCALLQRRRSRCG